MSCVDFKEKVFAWMHENAMLEDCQNVVIGVSGGADSMALLHLLTSQYTGNVSPLPNVIVCHVNHGLRGAESDRDEAFVCAYCRKHAIQCEVRHVDCAAEASKMGKSVEDMGRSLRYRFFEEIAQAFPAKTRIATAHNADDQLETVLFHLTRGSALSGLCGIPPVRGRIIRPLLCCSRGEIESYCMEQGIDYVTDSSNLSDAYTRNRLRHCVVPVLRALNPSVSDAVMRCTQSLRTDDELLDTLARDAYASLTRSEDRISDDALLLCELHASVLSRTLCLMLEQFGIQPSYDKVETLMRMRRENSGKVNLAANVYAQVQGGIFSIWRAAAHPIDSDPLCVAADPLRCPNYSLPGGKEIVFTLNASFSPVHHNPSPKINKNILSGLLDYDRIQGKLLITTRRPGDAVRLHGRGVTKTLKKLFNESALPQQVRDSLIVLRDDKGILFVEGFGTAERAAVGTATKKALRLEIKKHTGGILLL